MMDLAGRIVLVTAGSGDIGRATVQHFARLGVAGVVIAYRRARADAEALADDVNRGGVAAETVAVDVRSDEAVRAMLDAVAKRFGRLDVLVNNAGVTRWVPIRELDRLTDEVWDDILDVNLKGSFRCVRAAAPLLRATGGMVVNVASISGVLAPSTLSSIPYGASKAALIHMTRALAVALAPEVRVNAVAPAFVDTRWMRDHFGDDYDRVVAESGKTFPLGRIATPDDVASAIVGLVTGGDFITGQTVLVDGGASII